MAALYRALFILLAAIVSSSAAGLERPDVTFKIFQFPADKIPRIDGKTDDWDMAPKDYVIGTDQLVDDNGKYLKPDPKNLDVRARVGWVKGLNRLHQYKSAGNIVVVLDVEGPAGKSRRSKVWDVQLK